MSVAQDGTKRKNELTFWCFRGTVSGCCGGAWDVLGTGGVCGAGSAGSAAGRAMESKGKKCEPHLAPL